MKCSEKKLQENGWQQKTFRIRPDYIKVCSLLEFIAEKRNIERYLFFDDLFNYSIDYIYKNGFLYEFNEYEPKRTNKGFLLRDETLQAFEECHNFIKNIYRTKKYKKLLKAEFVELIIYIFCMNNLKSEELALIDIDWGISKL